MTQAISGPSPRIALLTGVLSLGGTTTFLCNFAGELVRRRIPVKIFSFEAHNPLGADFQRLNIPVFATSSTGIFEDRLLALLNELSRFQPTVAIASLSAAAFEALRYLPPGVFRFGMIQSDDPGPYLTINFYHQHLDAVAAVSLTIQKKIRAIPNFSRTPVHYLPYGVPMPDSLAINQPAAEHPLRILYLGRLDQEQKRVRLFPEILETLKASGIPFHWTVAGTGPEKEFLERAMKTSLPAQSLSFPGRVLYQDVPALLAEHDVFLLASDYEGLPLSLLEAMGWGLVPVASNLESGIREVVDPACGILVNPSDTRGYADAIIRLGKDRDSLARLAQNARVKVERDFSVAAMTNRWLALLPPPPKDQPHWPTTWQPRPILMSSAQWWYSPFFRPLRRLLKKLRR